MNGGGKDGAWMNVWNLKASLKGSKLCHDEFLSQNFGDFENKKIWTRKSNGLAKFGCLSKSEDLRFLNFR